MNRLMGWGRLSCELQGLRAPHADLDGEDCAGVWLPIVRQTLA